MAAKPVPRKRSDGTIAWRQPYRLRPGGVVTYETFTTQAEAEKFGRLVDRVGGQAARDARTTSTRSAADVPSLAAWLDTHLETVAATRAEGTAPEYLRLARRTWLPRLGPLPIDAITRDACIAWVGWQRRQTTVRGTPYATKSIVNAARLLSSVMRAAVAAELIPRNVAEGLPIPADQERPEMQILTHNEYAHLVHALPERWRPFVAFLVGTGCRFGEATALTRADFDLDADEPTVRISRAWKKGASGVYLGAPKSKKGVRTISLGRVVVEAVRPLVEAAERDGLVFTTPQGRRIQSQHFHTRVWQPALDRADLGKRPRVHDLRHTHASWQIAAGIRPEVLQRRLGHESAKTTYDVYGHLLPDSHAGAADAADAAMAGAHPEVLAPPVQLAQIGS